jgi:hypothetical protein
MTYHCYITDSLIINFIELVITLCLYVLFITSYLCYTPIDEQFNACDVTARTQQHTSFVHTEHSFSQSRGLHWHSVHFISTNKN